MQDSNEIVLRLLFEPVMTKHKLTEINSKGVIQALKAILSATEVHRLLFTLGNLPSMNMRVVEEEVLKGYQEDITEKLIKDHLFLDRNKELQIVRRPEILLTYTYMGKLYLAISERRLVTGEKGALTIVEIGDFQYLPRPNRSISSGVVMRSWGVDYQTTNAFLEANYRKAEHAEQVDIFRDDVMNLLRYDRDGTFIGAIPEPTMISTISLLKGITGRPGAENKRRRKNDFEEDELDEEDI